MGLRVLRVIVGLLLGGSGALMYAASWQRWAGACRWNQSDGGLCDIRQDHLFDFAPPFAPWEPVGDAAQLAGWSMLVLALVFVLLPWALTGRRPGLVTGAVLVGVVLTQAAVGVATLRSELTGSLVDPISGDLALYVWLFVPLGVLIRLAVDARGWTLAAAIFLILADPLVSGFTYAIGSYDTRPWYEAISGIFTATAGVCLLTASAFSSRSRTPVNTVTTASPAPAGAASSPGQQRRGAP